MSTAERRRARAARRAERQRKDAAQMPTPLLRKELRKIVAILAEHKVPRSKRKALQRRCALLRDIIDAKMGN